MAHSLSANKRVRQAERRNARNRARKVAVKTQVKSFLASVQGGKLDQAVEDLKKASAVLMRVSVKGTIHKNTASRTRSRLAKRLNAAKATATAKK